MNYFEHTSTKDKAEGKVFRWATNSLMPSDVGNLTSIGSDNGLSPGRRQAVIWTNAWILLIRPLETNFGEILIESLTFSF